MLEYSLSFSLFSPSAFLDFQFLRIQSRGVSSDLEEDPPMLRNLWLRALLEMKSQVQEAFHQEAFVRRGLRVLQMSFSPSGVRVLCSPVDS